MRLIDADVALQTAYTIYFEREATAVAEVLADTPTIDPAGLRPKGEWEVYLGGKELMCTACQATFWDEGGNGGSNFCPNCGADMRGNPHDS